MAVYVVGRMSGVWAGNIPKNRIFWSFLLVLVLCVGQSLSVKQGSFSTQGESTTLGVTANKLSMQNSQNSKPNNESSGEIDPEEERFRVAAFDWDRVQTPMLLGLVMLACTLAKLVFHFHQRLSSFCPESCILIVLGVVLGLILYAAGIRNVHFDADIIFFYMIPPIILDAGYFIPSRSFFDNIGTVLIYGLVGTILTTFTLGLALWGLSNTAAVAVRLGALECFGFAALMSAVDPMSVLTVFDEIHVSECLYIIVFGESLLNNGIAVVLYQMFEGLTDIGPENIQGGDVVAAIGSFLVVTGCGTLTGVLFGFLASLLTRVSDHVPVVQPLIVVIIGYIAYVFAEMFHLSGILACAFCGLTMRKYVKANMSKKSHTTTKYMLKLLASIADTMIFIYLGVTTVVNLHQWDWGFCIFTLIICLIIRAVVVIGLTALVNIGRLPQLNAIDQFIMSYGGLRGAIAFALVIDMREDIFTFHKMYFTTTILVILVTNFLMGATIKPLVEIWKVTHANRMQQSLNDQIHRRMMEHLMTGIEDITGHHGHHHLRQKFEYIDKHYLQKAFVSKNPATKNSWTAVHNYDKLNDKEVHEFENRSTYGTLFQHFHNESGTMRNFSFMKWLSSVSNGCMPNGYPAFGAGGPKAFDPGDQIQIDMQAMEALDTRKMRDDSKVHHIIEDSMFMPRKRYLGHRRHILPPEGDSHQQQLHHKARLHLRHLMSHHHRHDGSHHSCNGSVRNNGHNNGKPKKNVSFAEITQVTNVCDLCTPLLYRQNSKDEADTDIGSTRAESGASDDDSDLGGITFTAISTEDLDVQVDPDIPVEPVAVEMSLPWKRNTGREPLMSSTTHSMPDDHHPLTGEAPSWVNNTEYTSPGSPPVTPQSQHQDLADGAPPSEESSCNGCNEDNLDEEVNLIMLDTPDHKPVVPHNRDIRREKEDDNHDRTMGNNDSGNETIDCDNVVVLASQDQSQSGVDLLVGPDSPNAEKPIKPHDNKKNASPSSSASSHVCSSHQPLLSELLLDNPKTTKTDLPWRSNSTDNSHLPWRHTAAESTPNFMPEQAKLPWRQTSYDAGDDHHLPWLNCSTKEVEKRPLPWRQASLDSSDETSSLPMSLKNGKRTRKDRTDGNGLPPPWRNNSDSSLTARDRTLQRTDSGTPVLPWRDTSNMEVKLDQCAPRPRIPTPLQDDKEESHVPPPPWRHNPEPDCSVKSPSASCEADMYSLRPQHSSHSFRISEAESKHSEPIHVHHMIDLPQPRLHVEFDCESTCSLDLDSEQIDLNERMIRWLNTCDPQPLIPDDLEASLNGSPANNNMENHANAGTMVVTVDIENNVNHEMESVL